MDEVPCSLIVHAATGGASCCPRIGGSNRPVCVWRIGTSTLSRSDRTSIVYSGVQGTAAPSECTFEKPGVRVRSRVRGGAEMKIRRQRSRPAIQGRLDRAVEDPL